MSGPDLFVVCKNCGSEVSPYVTECPYCGQRVRKRAPKIGPDASPPTVPRRLRIPRLRPQRAVGIGHPGRLNATTALIGTCAVAAVLLGTPALPAGDAGVVGAGAEPWRFVTTIFLHQNLGYLFVTMLVLAVFGTSLERRFGPAAVVIAFLGAGLAGAVLADAAGIIPALGANGAALGVLLAWLVEERRGARRGEDREADLLGVVVLAAALLLLSLADRDASIVAALGGAAAGGVVGLALSAIRR